MSGLVRLTFVRYPPRDLSDRRDGQEARLAVRQLAGAVLAAAWVAAGILVATSVARGDTAWPGDVEGWLLLAVPVAGGVPLVLVCGVLVGARSSRCGLGRPGSSCAAGRGGLRRGGRI